MQESMGVKEAILHLYDAFSAGDVQGSMRLLTREEGAIGIGTDPEEWADNRAKFVAFLEDQMTGEERTRLEAGEDPLCFEEGSVGWAVDRPTFVQPNGSTVPSRMTAVMRREDGQWKLVHAHWSVGVPNQEVFGS